MPITNPAEINKTTSIPFIGILPSMESDNKNRFDRSIESLLINIQTIQTNKDNKDKIILISSATESCGKSLISRNIAINLANLGSRVLLVDNDQIKCNQHNYFNKRTISEYKFYEIDQTNISNLCINDINKNLFFIPRIKGLNNSFNFLYRKSYFKKLQDLKEYFDYIIIDTPPVLGLSETMLLMQYSDINLLIVRHKQTYLNHIRQTLYSFENTDIEIDGFIYNDQTKENIFGYYGDYKYNYYADKYTYEYVKDNIDRMTKNMKYSIVSLLLITVVRYT